MIKLDKLELPEFDAGDIRSEYTHYRSDSMEYRAQIGEDIDFYLGNQLTTAQKDYLVQVGQPPEANNKIKPAVEQVLSNIASGNPEWDVHSVGKEDNEIAVVLNRMLDKIWYDSNADSSFRMICKDYLIKGMGVAYVYPDWNGDGGLGAVKIKRLAPESVYVDPNSALPDFSDAQSIIYSDIHTRGNLLSIFPQYEEEIKEAEEDQEYNEQSSGKYNRDSISIRGSVNRGSEQQERVRKYIRWSMVNIPVVIIKDMMTGKTMKLPQNEYEMVKKKGEYAKYVKSGYIQENIGYNMAVREMCSFGNQLAYDIILPLDMYPIIPACNEHNGTPYPNGDVRHAKTPQRMLNRTEALIISHTNSTANFKLVYEDGAIEAGEIAKWHIPNAVIRANPGALATGKIKEFSPPPVSSQLYMEKQRYELDIESIFGAYKFQQGNPEGAPGTVGEAQILDEHSSRKQNWKINPVYNMLSLAGKVALRWIPNVYTEERTLRVVNPLGVESIVKINQTVIDDKTDTIKRINDVMTHSCDVRVVVGSTRAKSPMGELQKDLNLLSAGIYDRSQVIMNMKGDIDKVSLMQRQSEIAQLSQQLEQAQQTIKQLQGDMQTRERELFHSNMRAEIAEATKPVSKAVAEVKSTAKLEEARLRDKTKSTADELSRFTESAVNSGQEEAPTALG